MQIYIIQLKLDPLKKKTIKIKILLTKDNQRRELIWRKVLQIVGKIMSSSSWAVYKNKSRC